MELGVGTWLEEKQNQPMDNSYSYWLSLVFKIDMDLNGSDIVYVMTL